MAQLEGAEARGPVISAGKLHTILKEQVEEGDDKNFVQGYVECDYKKSNSRNVAHLRIGSSPIKAPYKIEQADFVSCQHMHFITNDNAIETLKPNGVFKNVWVSGMHKNYISISAHEKMSFSLKSTHVKFTP